jgi:Tfp pilus assembly protein PilX
MRNRLRPSVDDETGAVLVLALIFTVVVAMVIASLAAWSANDIGNIANFKQSRATLTAAEGALQAQMTAMRYVYATTCPGTPTTIDGVSIVVTCSTTVSLSSSQTRAVTFTASPQGQSSKVLITASVIYDDYSSVFLTDDCLPSTPSPTTCGSGMTVQSWIVTPNSS